MQLIVFLSLRFFSDRNPFTASQSVILPNRSFPGLMICPFVTYQPLGPKVRGQVPTPDINNSIYAYLPSRIQNLRPRKESFSPMRIFGNTTGIVGCKGAVNVDATELGETMINGMRSSAILGSPGAAKTLLVRDTQDLTYDYQSTFPTPSGWNQCQIYDINTEPKSSGVCNIANDVGNLGTLSVDLELMDENAIRDVWGIDEYKETTFCSTNLNSGTCNAIVGGPAHQRPCAFLDPQCYPPASLALILYNPDVGPPTKLDFSKVGSGGMSSDPNNQVSSRFLFTADAGKIGLRPIAYYWNVRVTLSRLNVFASASDAFYRRYTQSTFYSYAWYQGDKSRMGTPGGMVNIEFDSKFTNSQTDQVSLTALGAFVAIAGFVGAVWEAQFKVKVKIVEMRRFLKKRRDHLAQS
jgi:hypothetical protein